MSKIRVTLDKNNTATFLAILFHLSGLIGILFSPYRNWFILNTPLNLCLMTVLLVWTQPKKNSYFFLFLVLAFLTGMMVEMVGVNTELLFGAYSYGTVLGPKINGVPWLIGLNWFVVIFCSASVLQQIHDWFTKKMAKDGAVLTPAIAKISFLVDAAFLATFFDWLLEPAAVKLGFWQWKTTEIPFYNYSCWFIISLLLLLVLQKMPFPKRNHFAVHLFIIQLLFFMTLRTFL